MGNVEVAQRFLRAFAEQDWDQIETMLASDFRLAYQSASVPYGGTYHGAEGMRACVARFGEFWTDYEPSVPELIDAGDRLVVRGAINAAVRKTGVRVRIPVVEIWTLRDGCIVEILPYYGDTHALLQAAGEVTLAASGADT